MLYNERIVVKEERPTWCTLEAVKSLHWTIGRKHVVWQHILDIALGNDERNRSNSTSVDLMIDELTTLVHTGVARRTFGDCTVMLSDGLIGVTPALAVFSLFYLHALYRSDRTHQLLRSDSLVGWLLMGHTKLAHGTLEFEASFDKYFLEHGEIVYCSDDSDSVSVLQFSDEDALLAPANFHGNMRNLFPSTHETYTNYCWSADQGTSTQCQSVRAPKLATPTTTIHMRRNLTLIEYFYYLSLRAGYFLGPNDTKHAFDAKVPKGDIYYAFKIYCKEAGVGVPTDGVFWTALSKICIELKRFNKGSSGKRVHVAEFPPLVRCRELWLAEYKDWGLYCV